MANGNFSDLVTNQLMKKVLFDTNHICYTLPSKNYNNKNMWRAVRGSGATDMKPSPTGKCTNGPATWYRNAGIPVFFWNSASSATVNEMKRNLTKAGFQMIWSGTGQQANTLLASLGILRPGDVATMLSSNSAHAAMWTGQDWRSDFVLNNPYPYSSVGRGGNETFILWRHPQLLDKGTQLITLLNTPARLNTPQSTSQSTGQVRKKPKRINNFGGYPAWGKMYTDVQDLLLDNKVNISTVNQIIQACRNNGLSLNQTAVILGNAFQESKFRKNAKNDVSGGHHGVWQFSTTQYNKFGLSDWGKLLRYLMEEVAKTPEYLLTDKQGKIKKWISPHIGGNGWKGRHKAVWDTSNDIAKLSWAFGEGWERYGNSTADTDSRTLLSKLFQQYLINTNFGTTAYTPKALNNAISQLDTSNNAQTDEEIYANLNKLVNENNSLNSDMTQEYNNEDMFANLSKDNDLFDLGANFNTSYLNSYANSTYTPGSTYIDYYSPYKNYVHSNPISFLTGGTIQPLYLILDTNNQKSYLIYPAGPFKLPRKVLDYEKIIKTLLANQDKPNENILTSIYKDSLQD